MNIRRSFLSTVSALVVVGWTGIAAAQDKTLEYWVYSDFAQGDALALQQEFIREFTAKHPGVKIEIIGKGDADLTAGQIAGAASGNVPDVFMNGIGTGAQLVEVAAQRQPVHRAQQRRRVRDVFGPGLQQRREPVVQRAGLRRHRRGRDEALEGRRQQVVAAGEMPVEGGPRDVGAAQHRVHGDRAGTAGSQ